MGSPKPAKIGKFYGDLEVVGYMGKGVYECICHVCGEKCLINTANLRYNERGSVKCSNCIKKVLRPLKGDKEGKRYGKLLVKKFLGNRTYLCECDCGNVCEVKTYNLREDLKNRRAQTSCGCDVVHYEKDESFFERIDTEEKAYILGFIVSDGHVNIDCGNIKITLNAKDRELLEKIAREFKYTGPIREEKIKTKLPQGKFCTSEIATLVICSQKIVLDLFKLGLNQRKSFEKDTSFNWENIPYHLRRHFIRGLWDGDGTCNITRSEFGKISYTISCIGSYAMMNKLLEFLKEEFPDYKYELRQETNLYTGSLRFGRKKNFKEFTDFLYKDSKIFLKRKKDLYEANRKILNKMEETAPCNYNTIEINNKNFYKNIF